MKILQSDMVKSTDGLVGNFHQEIPVEKTNGETVLSYNPLSESSDNSAHFILTNGKLVFQDGDSFVKDKVLDTLKDCVQYAFDNNIELFKNPSERNEMIIKLCKMFSWPTDLINSSLELNPDTIELLDSSYGVDLNRKVQMNEINQDFVQYLDKDRKEEDINQDGEEDFD